jgi:protein-tyrosine-phosphatase
MKILFICKGNWFRSQMAAGIYNYLTCSHDADSVGTCAGMFNEPEGSELRNLFKTEYVFEVMDKIGLDIRSNHTKKNSCQKC